MKARHYQTIYRTLSITAALVIGQANAIKDQPIPAKPVPVTTDAVHKYFWANYLQFGGTLPQAKEWYAQLFSTVDPLPSYKGYVHLLFDLRDYQAITTLMPKLDATFKEDADLGFLFVQVLEAVGKQEESDSRVIRLNDKFKNNQEIAFHTAQTYVKRKEPENALKVINDLLNSSTRKSNNFIFHFLAAQISLQLNRKGDALEHTQKCIDLQPNFDKSWLLLGMLEEQAGKLTEAIKGYTNYLERAKGGNPEIEQHLLQLIFKQKLTTQKTTTTTLVVDGSCFEQALKMLEQKEYSKALQQIDNCLTKNPSDAAGKVLKVEILSAMGQEITAIELLKTWALEDPDNKLWFKTLHLLYRIGNEAKVVLSTLETIAKKQADKLLPHLFLADLYTREGQGASAIKHHKKALGITNDNELKTSILYQLGSLYYETNQLAAMKEVLEQGFALNTDYPPLNNLLAYYYATKGKDMVQAQKLIAIVLEKDPDNEHFLDTQAVIYYKQAQYDKALVIFEKIAKTNSNDFIIIKNLGKTQLKMGQIDNGITTIEQALNLAKTPYDKKKCEQLLKQWKPSGNEKAT